MHELKKRGIAVVGLMISNAITETDKQYRQGLLDYIYENALENDIFVPGFRKDISGILTVKDYVIVPSFEGLGLVTMEAMSSRTPVVAMDSGGSYELLKAAGCGVVYSTSGSEADITDAVIEAMNEPDKQLERGYQFCEIQSYKNYSKGLHQIFE